MLAPPSSSRKRKRGGVGGDERQTIGSPFVVQPYVSSTFDVSTKISPAVILPRSHVPVSWIAGAPSRLFDSPLESPVLCAPGNVVIVKIEGERQLSAVEKVGENVYVLYRLSTQLRMKDVRKVAAQTKHLPNAPPGSGTYDIYNEEWWCGVGNADYPFNNITRPAANDATVDMGLNETETTELRRSTPTAPTLPPTPPALNPEESILLEDDPPTMPEVLDQVRKQYLETLYMAKTSLAYFSKSTLSRARATCHDFEGPPLTSRFDKLAQFLRGMILPLAKMDVKYRKSLVQSVLEHDVDDASVFRPDEESYIQRWRYSHFEERFLRETDFELKQRLEELRIRETELQIILLLEILALNKQHPPVVENELNSGSGEKGKIKSKKGKKGKKSKPADKNPDPDVLLDLLVDRLCIWNSIGSDDAAEKGGSPAKENDIVSDKDHLRHFSVEVIMAFYASKLPEKCSAINKKFGGGGSSKPSSSIVRPAKAPKDRRAALKRTPGLARTMSAPSTTYVSRSRGTTAEPLSLLAATPAGKTIRGGTLNSRSFAKKVVQMEELPKKKVDEELKSVIQALKRPNRGAIAAEIVDDVEKRLARAATTSRKPKKTIKISATDVHVQVTPKKRKDTFASSRLEESNSFDDFSFPNTNPNPLHFNSTGGAVTPISRRASLRPPIDEGVVLGTPRKSLFGDIQPNRRPSTLTRPRTANDADTIFATPIKKAPVSPGFWSPAGGVAIAKEPLLKPTLFGRTEVNLAEEALLNSSFEDDHIDETPMKPSTTGRIEGVSGTSLTHAFDFCHGSVQETPVKKSPQRPVFEEGRIGETPAKAAPFRRMVGETPLQRAYDSVQDTPVKKSPERPTDTSIYDALGWDDEDD